MRRLAPAALGLALACGTTATSDPGPLDTFYKPSGLAVHDGKLLVASSNFDLLYDINDGGTLISVDPYASANPAQARLVSGVRIASYSGELAVADAARCPTLAESVAVVAARADTSLYPISIGAADGALRCDRCAVPLTSGFYGDPLAVAVACTPTRATAYAAYLRSFDNRGWIAEYDLVGHAVRAAQVGTGPVRGMAFDAERQRLWIAALSTGGSSTLGWVDLAGSCAFDQPESQGGCAGGSVPTGGLPPGVEFRSIALSSAGANLRADVRRAYVTGRLYDPASAASAGGRNTDYGGELLAVDLIESAAGSFEARWTKLADLGFGAAEVRVLPRLPAWPAGRRDVVAALDGTTLTIFDDETGAMRTFGLDPTTGAPVLGHEPWGIGVDPTPSGGAARLYVGSFLENFVTPIQVPLDAPSTACILSTAGTCLSDTAPTVARIRGGTP